MKVDSVIVCSRARTYCVAISSYMYSPLIPQNAQSLRVSMRRGRWSCDGKVCAKYALEMGEVWHISRVFRCFGGRMGDSNCNSWYKDCVEQSTRLSLLGGFIGGGTGLSILLCITGEWPWKYTTCVLSMEVCRSNKQYRTRAQVPNAQIATSNSV
jgi:hypothetical protein